MQIPQRLTPQQFAEMAQLEARFYGTEYIAPPEEAYRWYCRLPHSTVAATEHGRVIGFINLFPVKKEIYARLRHGTLSDAELLTEDLCDPNDAESELLMFLSCIVVDPDHRKDRLALRLLQQAMLRYRPFAHLCTTVLIDTVTSDGERFARSLGFLPLGPSAHDSLLLEQPYAALWDRVTELLSPQAPKNEP